jgi:hypothetical protein
MEVVGSRTQVSRFVLMSITVFYNIRFPREDTIINPVKMAMIT